MAYVDSILQPGETVRAVGKLHWIVDIQVKSGMTNPGAEASVTGSSRDYSQPAFSYGGRTGPVGTSAFRLADEKPRSLTMRAARRHASNLHSRRQSSSS